MKEKILISNSHKALLNLSQKGQKLETKKETGGIVPIVLPKQLEQSNDPIKEMRNRRKNHSESCI